MIDALTKSWIRNEADAKAAANGCRFDLDSACWTVWWIERYCRLYEGSRWAGTPLILRGAPSMTTDVILDDWDKGGRELSIERAHTYMECVGAGEVCDWQYEVVIRIFGWVRYSEDWGREVRRFRKGGIWVPKKNKKALALDTLLPTPTGWTTIGEVQSGDELLGADGHTCRVTHVHPVIVDEESYLITFSNGEKVRCNGEHLWKTAALQRDVIHTHGRGKAFCGNQWAGPGVTETWSPIDVRATRDIAESVARRDGAANHSIAMSPPVELPDASLQIDPYVLGVWLGDGDSDGARLTCHVDDYGHYRSEFASVCVELRKFNRKSGANAGRCGIGRKWGNTRTILRSIATLDNKHIPRNYLRGSIRQRLALLQGLMDTDGCIDKTGKSVTFCGANKRLVDGVSELLSTLGVKHSVTERTAKIDGVDKGPCWWILFTAFRDVLPVFRLPRKLKRMRETTDLRMRPRSTTAQIVSVERIQPIPMRCITVAAADGMFLFGRTMLPTHNSPTLAAIGIHLIMGDGEQGQKVFPAAKNGAQVRENVGQHAIEMIRASEELNSECEINLSRMRITHPESRSYMQPLSSGSSRSIEAKEGINGSVLIDETHVVDREFIATISRAGISRAEPLFLQFSTAGKDPDSYGKEEFDYGESNNRSGDDEAYFFAYYGAEQTLTDEAIAADPEGVLRAANPALGHTVHMAEALADYHASKKDNRRFADFKTYRLNIWQRSANPWIRMDDWQACGSVFTEGSLYGQPCGAGLDLGRVDDMSSLSLVFPEDMAEWSRAVAEVNDKGREQEDDGDTAQPAQLLGQLEQNVKVLTWYWLPEAVLDRRAIDAPYAEWARDGHLRLTDTTSQNTVDPDAILADIRILLKKFDVKMFAYDPWYAMPIIGGLKDTDGFRDDYCWPFEQTNKNFAFPSMVFERLVVSGKLHHNHNPITTWQAGHVQVKEDTSGNIRPVKPKRQNAKKIDGIVATIQALDAAMRLKHAGSVYERRGLLTV